MRRCVWRGLNNELVRCLERWKRVRRALLGFDGKVAFGEELSGRVRFWGWPSTCELRGNGDFFLEFMRDKNVPRNLTALREHLMKYELDETCTINIASKTTHLLIWNYSVAWKKNQRVKLSITSNKNGHRKDKFFGWKWQYCMKDKCVCKMSNWCKIQVVLPLETYTLDFKSFCAGEWGGWGGPSQELKLITFQV